MKWMHTPSCIFPLLLVVTCAETKLLTADNCKTEQTLGGLNGTFEVFRLENINDYINDNEGDSNKFRCFLSRETVPDDCMSLLESNNFTENAGLAVNGAVQIEGSEVSSKMEDGKKIYNITMNYESHQQATLTCMTISKNVTYTSSEIKISEIQEYHPLILTTSSTEVTAGQSYTLNCSAENERGLNMIDWSVTVDDQSKSRFECTKEDWCSEEKVQDPPASIITIEASEDIKTKKLFSYECNTRYNSYHKNQHAPDPVKITIIPEDKSWIVIVIGAVSALVVTSAVVIVILTVRHRRLKSARISCKHQDG